jgi:hypothetical protein
MLAKYVAAPLALAAIGYFGVGPHIGKGLFGKSLTASNQPAATDSSAATTTKDPATKDPAAAATAKPDAPAIVPPDAEVKVRPAESNAPNVGADSDATSATPAQADPVPVTHHRRRRKHHTATPVEEAPRTDAPQANPESPSQPIDDGGSAGGDGTSPSNTSPPTA